MDTIVYPHTNLYPTLIIMSHVKSGHSWVYQSGIVRSHFQIQGCLRPKGPYLRHLLVSSQKICWVRVRQCLRRTMAVPHGCSDGQMGEKVDIHHVIHIDLLHSAMENNHIYMMGKYQYIIFEWAVGQN